MLLEIENRTMINVASYTEFEKRMELELMIYGMDNILLKCKRSNTDLLGKFAEKLSEKINKKFTINEF